MNPKNQNNPNIIIYCEQCERVLYKGDLIGRQKFGELTNNKCRYCGRQLKQEFSIRQKKPVLTLDNFKGDP